MRRMPVTSIHIACLCAAWCPLCDDDVPVPRQRHGTADEA
jgi:hypothetical protein